MAASDKHGLDSIITLHKQLDDDEDGNIDYAESDDVRTSIAYHLSDDLTIFLVNRLQMAKSLLFPITILLQSKLTVFN